MSLELTENLFSRVCFQFAIHCFGSPFSEHSKLPVQHFTTPFTSGFYHIHGNVPKWLKKVELNVNGKTSQQVSAAVRADRKSVAIKDSQTNYLDNGRRLNGAIHSKGDSNKNASSVSMCEDGITRRLLTFVAGCTIQRYDLEVRSSCSSDMNYPKCKYELTML